MDGARVGNDRLLQNAQNTLDGITARLESIESNIHELIRVSERLNAHEANLTRTIEKLNKHDDDIKSLELHKAVFSDERFNDIVEDLKEIKDIGLFEIKRRLDVVEQIQDRHTGQRDIVKELLKIGFTIVSGVLIWKLTRG